MDFSIIYKESGKLHLARNISEYMLLQKISKQISEEDIELCNPLEKILYIGFIPTFHSSVKEYVDFANEKGIVNQAIVAVYYLDRYTTVVKIFKKGIADLQNFMKASNLDHRSVELAPLHKEFKEFDTIIPDALRNSIGRLIMRRGLNKAVAELKYGYLESQVLIKPVKELVK